MTIPKNKPEEELQTEEFVLPIKVDFKKAYK